MKKLKNSKFANIQKVEILTKITEIITTFQRAKLLRNNLQKQSELTHADEILVIDDGGTDETLDVVKAYEDILPIRYIYTHNPGSSICSHARNVGVKQAQHDWIMTCEPELWFVTDVVKNLKHEIRWSAEKNHVVSSGKIHFLLENGQRDFTAEGWVAPHIGLYKKSWLEEIGGWDESFPGNWGWDDTDLLTRLRWNGHNQFIDPNIEANHQFHGLGADKNSINEKHFLAKEFPRDIVANKDTDWGEIRHG